MCSAQNYIRPVAMQTSASQATSGQTSRTDHLTSSVPMLTKYAKIQPAVAIKPKPVIKPASHKSSFNPEYDPQTSTSTFFPEDQAGNINVLRKWVLPARPRPGRKPVANAAPTASNVSPNIDDSRGLNKKRFKTTKPPVPQDQNSLPIASGAGSPGAFATAFNSSGSLTSMSRTSSSNISTAKTGLEETATNFQTTGATPTKPASKQVSALQETYLAKLKEQELIQNYIDALLNQIKELRFVQSGMITTDALSSINDTKKKVSTLQTPDQLDHISNFRDLEKFLAHLTTQSNVIHSVTKKFIDEGSGTRNQLQSQIEHYTRLRQRHREKNCEAVTKTRPGIPRHNTMPSRGKLEPTSGGVAPLPSNTRFSKSLLNQSDLSVPPSTFTPSLLRPLDIDLFDQEDEIIGVEPLEGEFFDKLRNTDDPELEFAPILKQASSLGRKRLGCGFCSGETPCLCFDADIIFGEK